MIILVSWGIVAYIWNALMTSDYFKVKEVIATEGNSSPFSYLKGRNIFTIDLEREARSISDAYPDFRRVDVVRNLPDRIIVAFDRRLPVAQIKLYKPLLIDDDGMLVSATGSPQESQLPVIYGLETKIFGPKPGRRYSSAELNLAIGMIKELKANKFLKNYRIKKIDVASLVNASFTVVQADQVLSMASDKPAEGIEVKIGPDNIRNKIMIFAGIIIQTRADSALIKYVDLRFKEPVIKFQDPKEKKPAR
jgi:hypothetical protein